MTEQEIFEKLKDALDYQYLATDFGGTEVTNLEEYLCAIKMERTLEKHFDESERNLRITYQEFIHYLSDRAIGNKDYIIEAFDNNEFNNFKGYLKVNKVIKDNKLMMEFEVDDMKLTAEWQAGDNYAVWQRCGYCGDDYYGYLLFPTYNDDEYFCLEYKC